MKYFISYVPAGEKISKAGQWTIWESKWCKVRHVNDDGTALLYQIDYPVKVEFIDRYYKVLRNIVTEQAPMKSSYLSPEAYKWDMEYVNKFPDEIIIPDEHWMEFISRYVTDTDIVIQDTTDFGKYNKKAIPYTNGQIKVDVTRLRERCPHGMKSGIERVISALETTMMKNPMEHDDRFKNHELATSAMYCITRNTNLLGKTVPLPIRETDRTLDDLAEAAAILICEMDRILRNQK